MLQMNNEQLIIAVELHLTVCLNRIEWSNAAVTRLTEVIKTGP